MMDIMKTIYHEDKPESGQESSNVPSKAANGSFIQDNSAILSSTRASQIKDERFSVSMSDKIYVRKKKIQPLNWSK